MKIVEIETELRMETPGAIRTASYECREDNDLLKWFCATVQLPARRDRVGEPPGAPGAEGLRVHGLDEPVQRSPSCRGLRCTEANEQ